MKSEWGRWLRYFRDCSVQRLRERATAAPSMDSLTITAYLEEKLNAERVVDLLSINNDQLLLTGNEQTRALQRQFRAKRRNIDPPVEHQASEKLRRTRAGRKAQPVALEEPTIPKSLSAMSSSSRTSNDQTRAKVDRATKEQTENDTEGFSDDSDGDVGDNNQGPEDEASAPPMQNYPGESLTLSSLSSSRAKIDRGRRSSVSGEEYLDDELFRIYPREFDVFHYMVKSANVGRAFHEYQVASLTIVNKAGTMATVSNLSSFFVLKLPLEYLPFQQGLEDTYCHGVIDALLTRQFPARSKFHLEWANKEARGSKERRINGYKPDGVISNRNNHRELAFLEVKPPKEQHCKRAFLEDLWKLANFCKDTIDSHLRQGLRIHKAAALQVFGHGMVLYTMVYDHGIYHWSKSCSAYLPRDQTDTGCILPCLRLLTTLENFLESIYTNIGPSTPPRIEYDNGDQLTPQDTGRVSKVTPTKRPMFGK
ncbi:hypothetical protein BGZ83_001143 [Gryganskiella cystojenkinii]|nr:hypothetical protein BGZ83_001143 [Gryganskiella cystojenkinii]